MKPLLLWVTEGYGDGYAAFSRVACGRSRRDIGIAAHGGAEGSHVEDALEVLVAAKAPRLVLERPDRRRTGRRALRRGESVWASKREMPPAVAMNRATRRPPFQVGSG